MRRRFALFKIDYKLWLLNAGLRLLDNQVQLQCKVSLRIIYTYSYEPVDEPDAYFFPPVHPVALRVLAVVAAKAQRRPRPPPKEARQLLQSPTRRSLGE